VTSPLTRPKTARASIVTCAVVLAAGAYGADSAARHWHQALERRSQKSQLPWNRMNRIVTRWLPPTRTLHPVPEMRFAAT
jgi:hypothetical protein